MTNHMSRFRCPEPVDIARLKALRGAVIVPAVARQMDVTGG